MLVALIIVSVLLVLAVFFMLALQKQIGALTREVEELRSGQDISERISYLVHSGREVEAIAVYRRATGLGLAESRNAVAVIAKNNPQL